MFRPLMFEPPQDLEPLPTMPFSERPVALPLDIEECRTALWMAEGNITRAAAILKVSPPRLRSFVRGSPRLLAEVDEAREQIVDQAERVIAEALHSGESNRSDPMAKYVASNLGKGRGYSTRVESTGPGGVGLFDGIESEARGFMDRIVSMTVKPEATSGE